jgi:nitrate reductase molybdenum cofactor assembly chaperone NarJ/NarW
MTDQNATTSIMSDSAAMEEARSVFKVLSMLLNYPEKRLIEARRELGDVVNEFSHPIANQKCGDFLAYVDAISLIQLQEEYTRLFDFNPATCLNLTFHECGESKGRGFALANLSRLYKDAGYELASRELPDYLPLILEFLSVCSGETCAKILTQYDSHISGLVSRLLKEESGYATLVEALSELVRELTGKGD